MTNTASWAWTGTGTWPGFSTFNANNIGTNGNGLVVNPNNLTSITWVDGDKNGTISDNDSGDGTSAGTDRVTINGQQKSVHEIGAYSNSTMVVNGQAKAVLMGVWVFTDGTYIVRINDVDIPEGVHYTAVDSLKLGTFNGVEYGASHVSTRDDAFVCFAAGTLILTDRGNVAVERLAPGDRVMTADHGFQPLRWVGQATVIGQGNNAPVLFDTGALGNLRPLRVSRQHRMVISGWQAELMFGAAEVLVPAHRLMNDGTIRLAPCGQITYVHILFDQHEIVFAEGLASESFHPGPQGLRQLDSPMREELFRLLPALARDSAALGPLARPSLHRDESRFLMAAR